MSLEQELAECRQEYETAVEAIRHQQLVLQRLEGMMRQRVPSVPLSRDAATMTESDLQDSAASSFVHVVLLNVQLEREHARRRIASDYHKHFLEQLKQEIEALKKLADDALPPGVQVDAILRGSKGPGNVVEATLPPQVAAAAPEPRLDVSVPSTANTKTPPDVFGSRVSSRQSELREALHGMRTDDLSPGPKPPSH